MSQADLIQISDLLQYGASSDFLSQFQPRPLSVQIVAGGALGSMTWQWQSFGDPAYSAVIASENAPPWVYSLPDPGFGTLTFASGTYNANDVYTISTAGVVTGGTGGGIGMVSATRFDPRAIACTSATSKGVTWLQPRCVPPIISVGPQVKEWLACVAVYALRSRQGMTPPDAGAGDDNVRLRAVDAEKQLRAIGISEDRPPDIIDSSTSNTGAGFAAYPIGDSLRGF